MTQTEKTWLFMTRVQPGLHEGQIDGIMQWVQQWLTKVLIGIWSSNKEWTHENPFTYSERKKMVELSCKTLLQNIKVEVYQIPDFWNNEQWLNYLNNNLPHFDYVLTGNPRVQEIFEATNKTVIPIEMKINIKASSLRGQLAQGNYSELKKHLPEDVVAYLQDINAFSRLKEIMKNERITPKLTVDIVFFDKEGNIILIERGNEPYGKALPGGFIDYWESPEEAAIRETKEETSADVKIKSLIGVWGEPNRDPRGHAVTIAYACDYVWGEIVAWDDAKKIIRVKPEDIDSINFAFPDHKEIIKKTL